MNAYRQPTAATSGGMRWMVTRVSVNPSAVCTVSIVPTRERSASSAIEAENCAESATMVGAQSFLAQILNLQRRYEDAGKLYDRIDVWTARWEPKRREAVNSGLARVSVMLTQGDSAAALDIAPPHCPQQV